MSALEHAVPERFFNNPTQCNPVGSTTPIAGLPACPQGISAVKAIALGAQAGQKIFTITALVYQNNPSIVSTNLSAHSQSTKDRIQQALDAGYEVTIHEAPITQDGWTGAGFTIIDPGTGAGGYLIEGGSNGAWLLFFFVVFFALLGVLLPLLAAGGLAATTTMAATGVTYFTSGLAALSFFFGCLVDPGVGGAFILSSFQFGVMVMAFVAFSPTLFVGGLLVSALLFALSFAGVLSDPDKSRLGCRAIGLG